MGNPGADYYFLFFVYRYADPIVSNADFVFPGKPSHLLKISEIERILTPEIFNFLPECYMPNVKLTGFHGAQRSKIPLQRIVSPLSFQYSDTS